MDRGNGNPNRRRATVVSLLALLASMLGAGAQGPGGVPTTSEPAQEFIDVLHQMLDSPITMISATLLVFAAIGMMYCMQNNMLCWNRGLPTVDEGQTDDRMGRRFLPNTPRDLRNLAEELCFPPSDIDDARQLFNFPEAPPPFINRDEFPPNTMGFPTPPYNLRGYSGMRAKPGTAHPLPYGIVPPSQPPSYRSRVSSRGASSQGSRTSMLRNPQGEPVMGWSRDGSQASMSSFDNSFRGMPGRPGSNAGSRSMSSFDQSFNNLPGGHQGGFAGSRSTSYDQGLPGAGGHATQYDWVPFDDPNAHMAGPSGQQRPPVGFRYHPQIHRHPESSDEEEEGEPKRRVSFSLGTKRPDT